MARTKSVTSRILNLTGFRSVAGYMNDASDWLSSVGERESVFEEMRNDPRVESLIKNRKDKVLQMTGSFSETRN